MMEMYFANPFAGMSDRCVRMMPFFPSYCMEIRNGDNEMVNVNDEEQLSKTMDVMDGMGQVDLYENETEYEMLVDLPGLEKEDVNVQVDHQCVMIDGERKEDHEIGNAQSSYHIRERSIGKFHREVSLPENADVENITACYNNGVLCLSIPKLENTQTRRQIVIQ